jgi:hypothetical protein
VVAPNKTLQQTAATGIALPGLDVAAVAAAADLVRSAMEAAMARRRKRFLFLLLGTLSAIAIICFFALDTYIAQKRTQLRDNFVRVQMGDSKERVLELLGRPNNQFDLGNQLSSRLGRPNLLFRILFESRERWTYGVWHLPWVSQIVDNYIIDFDDEDRVAGLSWPN